MGRGDETEERYELVGQTLVSEHTADILARRKKNFELILHGAGSTPANTAAGRRLEELAAQTVAAAGSLERFLLRSPEIVAKDPLTHVLLNDAVGQLARSAVNTHQMYKIYDLDKLDAADPRPLPIRVRLKLYSEADSFVETNAESEALFRTNMRALTARLLKTAVSELGRDVRGCSIGKSGTGRWLRIYGYTSNALVFASMNVESKMRQAAEKEMSDGSGQLLAIYDLSRSEGRMIPWSVAVEVGYEDALYKRESTPERYKEVIVAYLQKKKNKASPGR